jgi:hypothetical protein
MNVWPEITLSGKDPMLGLCEHGNNASSFTNQRMNVLII